MATKEEHLGRETAAFLKTRGSIGHGEATLLLSWAFALAERDAAREELAKLQAAQPAEAVPIAGGVTELMLDEIQHLVDQYPYCPGVDEQASEWLTRARAVIRAQKRVDVAELRGLVTRGVVTGYTADCILRAIGDEPAAEAPAPFSITSTGGKSVQWSEAPAPAPAEAQEGPFTFDYNGTRSPLMYIRRDGKVDAEVQNFHITDSDEFVRLLNAGLETPKLRARVAELEGDVDFWTRSHQNDAGAMAEKYNREKARADAAEAKLAALETEREAARRSLAESMPSGHGLTFEWAIKNALGFLMRFPKLEADSEKLAALGENPIPRALVERHRDANHPENREARLCDAILAGREPVDGGAK